MKKIVYIFIPFLIAGCNDDDCPEMESTSDCEAICLSYDATQSVEADGSSLVKIFIERSENADDEFQEGSITIDNGLFEDGRATKSLDLTNNFRDTINVVAGINPHKPMSIEATLGSATVLTSKPLLIELSALAATDIYQNLTGSITDLPADGESERLLELQIAISVNVRYTAERNILRAFGGIATTTLTDTPLNGNSSVVVSSDQIPGESIIKLEFLESTSSEILYEELISITSIQALPDRISVSAGSTLSVDSTGAVVPITTTLSRDPGKTSEGIVVNFYALSDPGDIGTKVGRFSIDNVESTASETVSTDFIFDNSEELTTDDRIYIIAETESESGTIITDTWPLSITN